MRARFYIVILLCLLPIIVGAGSSDIAEIVGYKRWQSVTEKPVRVEAGLWSLCRPPTPEEKERLAMNEGPHKGGFIRVRVNDLGLKLFLNERNPQFPDGTVIVKEKLLAATDIKPDSLGVMIKKDSQWEFAYIDSQGSVSRGKGQLSNCYSCHAKMHATDGVSRSYLSR